MEPMEPRPAIRPISERKPKTRPEPITGRCAAHNARRQRQREGRRGGLDVPVAGGRARGELTITRVPDRMGPADPIEGIDQAEAGGAAGTWAPGGIEHLGEIGPAEVGHAEHPPAGLGIVISRMDRDDVRVLEPGEDPRLVPFRPRDFDRHGPSPQVDLLGQVHPGEGTPAELPEDPEPCQDVPHARKVMLQPWSSGREI